MSLKDFEMLKIYSAKLNSLILRFVGKIKNDVSTTKKCTTIRRKHGSLQI